MAKIVKACGNDGCGVSTGICESLTFGQGRLSFNGYWEKPCAPCARAHEVNYPSEGECWPFAWQNVVELSQDAAKECDSEDLKYDVIELSY